jgi:hypothetical protein
MADNEVSITFTGDSSGAEDASKRTKEQVDKATDSLKILDDLLGVKIPESISKMLAESELIGPALDAAFAPLAIISLGMALIDVTDKVSKFVGEALTGAADLRKFDEQIKTENKALEEYARKTKEATRALELLNAPDTKTRNALKLQFQIEDQGGSAAQLQELLKTKTAELQELLHKSTTETVSDIGSGMTVEVEKLVSETDEGKEKINELSRAIVLLGARQKEAAAEEALTNKQNQNDLDREASQSKAIMAILDALGLTKKKISNAAEAHSSASTASANTLADVPYPANIPAAAQVFTLGEALAIEAKSSAGGDWRVDRDRLNFVHANETILPAGIAGKLRNMVEGGSPGSGITVVVNHSVSAVDAASFQGHIRRHSNMIANEVTRALKRKGVR